MWAAGAEGLRGGDLDVGADRAASLPVQCCLVTVLIATISVNIAANVVPPAYDLANLAPRFISVRTGALITGVLGAVIMPWKLTETPELCIFTRLRLGGGLLGAIAGILIADCWIVRRTVLDKPPAGYGWAVGLASSLFLYAALTRRETPTLSC